MPARIRPAHLYFQIFCHVYLKFLASANLNRKAPITCRMSKHALSAHWSVWAASAASVARPHITEHNHKPCQLAQTRAHRHPPCSAMLSVDELETFGERRRHVRRAAIASRGTHYSAFDRVIDTVCTGLLTKTVYVVCATTLTMSLIVECIMVNLIILPYRHEANFEEANCYLQYIEPDMPLLKCENKCSKDRSMFPCLRVHIVYEWENRNHTAILFDTIGTHANYKKPRVRLPLLKTVFTGIG